MKKLCALLLIIMLAFSVTPAFASEYTDNMQYTLTRGFKNIISCVLELPITIQEYHEGPGKPGIRHIRGVFDGVFQTVIRAGSGVWDILAAFIPGQQDGMPVDPETLF